jgi:exonuclease III
LRGLSYSNTPDECSPEKAVKLIYQAKEKDLNHLFSIIHKDKPCIVMGDFNEPSHLDWTDTTVEIGRVPCDVQWKTSKLFESKGLKDIVRHIYPDPVTHPFLTVDVIKKDDENNVPERIDFTYVSPQFKPVSAKRILCPYSDHLPVVSTMEFLNTPRVF